MKDNAAEPAAGHGGFHEDTSSSGDKDQYSGGPSRGKEAAALAELFSGNERYHGTHGEPVLSSDKKNKWEIRTTAKTVVGPATPELWRDHLSGKRPLGVIPICADGGCTWGSIDVDQYDGDHTTIIRVLEEAQLPLVPVRSKSGGLHLFRFVPRPVPASAMRDELRAMAQRLGVGGAEIFPKQGRAQEDADRGSWIVVPYFGDTYGGKLCEQEGLKKTGSAMTVEEFVRAVLRARVPLKAAAPFADGPPCLQAAAAGVDAGGRNTALFNMAVYARKRHPDSWRAKVDEYNGLYMRPQLSSSEVADIVKSAARRDYSYQCDCAGREEECRTRPHGKGRPANYPTFQEIQIEDGDDPVWNIKLAGDDTVVIAAEDLHDQKKFLRACLAQTHRTFHRMKKEDDWADFLNEAAGRATHVAPPPSVTRADQFRELLDEFCTNRQRGAHREDLMLGRPWQDDDTGRHYFRLKDLQRFVVTEGFSVYSRKDMAKAIEALGGGKQSTSIKGWSVDLWWVPATLFDQRPTPSAPPMGQPGGV